MNSYSFGRPMPYTNFIKLSTNKRIVRPRQREIYYSPEKPENCPVKVKLCEECTETDCTFNRM